MEERDSMYYARRFELENLIRMLRDELEKNCGEIDEMLEWELPKGARRIPFIDALVALKVHGVYEINPPIKKFDRKSGKIPYHILDENKPTRFHLENFNNKELCRFCREQGINLEDDHLGKNIPATLEFEDDGSSLFPIVKVDDTSFRFKSLKYNSIPRAIMKKFDSGSNIVTKDGLYDICASKMSAFMANSSVTRRPLTEIFRNSHYEKNGVLGCFFDITKERMIIKRNVNITIDQLSFIEKASHNPPTVKNP